MYKTLQGGREGVVKLCYLCGKLQLLNAFHKDGHREGRGVRQPCKQCRRDERQEQYALHKRRNLYGRYF